ncbi:MCM-domain-containing protein [Wallemia mellicola CBS 633.66]|uniref:DNA replication licensing factor MCM5 n=1 Tax=Wallemia mellicola (strain ATCC MYA-4683 / CBS 633.66) TaxID=671144 RepID=I4YC05_WALMC|nr:MCM-domain-containing protein [Wallemia mellicola CBS 633.66]EIM21497.1 MCM-domain-containing protein [Wallemia mellicola CBS 633.66]TIC20240.1 MCM-domain-containing protein [Wallemia mellicola]|eukprot:XP_006958526.1 MCM-domain-containing protein [Wallemia mellicola CBS 633.66]
MSGFDKGAIYTTAVLPADANSSDRAPSSLERDFSSFINNFRLGDDFIYRDNLRSSLLAKVYALEVSINHLLLYNEDLGYLLSQKPADLLPILEVAVTRIAKTLVNPLQSDTDSIHIPTIQISLKSQSNLVHFRDLNADTVSKLVRIPGIVISASTLSSRAINLHIMCRSCRSTKNLNVSGGWGTINLPRKCDAEVPAGQPKECPIDPYTIVHDKCKYIDQQTVKLQEAPDMVPVGELPRHLLLNLDRYLTAKVVPGSRVIATGIYSTFQASKQKGQAPALRQPYIRVVGLEVDSAHATSGAGGRGKSFTPEEEEEFSKLSQFPNLYERFASSIAPSIYGNLDIKKAVACLLFGGSKKILPDGMRLRGDINVLLLGDPGTAKSQLLKFVEKVSPIAVYTSGKGSSAAGLTASVQRDTVSRDFYLEGGAMVLADGGVVCIDEFDKMRDEDRVAIHEAMEQQTISIAKAGITTILNSRTSVLAAANPIFGRYDDMKSPGENIDFQTTILSRFDMIFIVKDEHNESRDRTIAKHVMNLHAGRQNEESSAGSEIDLDKMKRYVMFCKSRCAPRLSNEASEKLSSHFVSLRKEVQQVEKDNDERSSIPITVRQLEAIIRISESLAKMRLSTQVHEHDVEEAIRLFKFSTMDAVSAGNVEGMTRGELMDEVHKIEREVRRRLPIGWSTSYSTLVREFCSQQGFSQHALERTLFILDKKEVIRFSNQKKVVIRTGV